MDQDQDQDWKGILFQRMLTGFAVHQVLADSFGNPVGFRFLELNEAYEQMWGLPNRGTIGRTVAEALPRLGPFCLDIYRKVALTGESIQFEHYLEDRKKYFEVLAFRPLPGLLAVQMSDITQRKLVEAALEESEARFRALVENLTDVVLRVDRHLLTLYISPSLQAINGADPDGIVGNRIGEIGFPAEQAGLLEAEFGRVFATRQPAEVQVEVPGTHRLTVIEWRLFPEFDRQGNVETVIGIGRDITEQRLAEKALRESAERFKTLSNAASEGIVFTYNDRIIDCNERFASLVGESDRQALAGRSVLDYFPETRRQIAEEQLRHPSDLPFETELSPRSGVSRWVRIQAKMMLYQGISIRVAGILDLTDQKKAEENLRQTNERLHALASQLESVREQEKMRVSRMIHDELGQVLTGMKIEIDRLANWLERPLASPSPPGAERGGGVAGPRISQARVQEKVLELRTLAEEALVTVRQIARELRPSIIDDLGLAAAVEWQMVNFRERTGIAFDLRISPKKLGFPNAVNVGIFRILQEALTNIMRHAQAGRVTVRMSRRKGRFHLEVRDDGIGISALVLDSSRSLGIIGMQERARQCGGTLEIEGKPGQGTTVRLDLPFPAPPASPAPQVSPPGKPRHRS